MKQYFIAGLSLATLSFVAFLGAGVFAQTGSHVIYVNANQDVDFSVEVGARTYSKAETTPVADPPIKAGRPGDPFKGWRLESSEPAKKYIVRFKPLQGFYVSTGEYTREYDIPAGYDYFTYTTNIQLEPTEIGVWATFEGAGFGESIKAPFTLSGPVMYQGEAGGVTEAWKKERVLWGKYTITWGSVPGYTTPLQETREITAEPVLDPPGPTRPGVLHTVVATGRATFFTTYRKAGQPPLEPSSSKPKSYCEGRVNIDLSSPDAKPGIHVGSNSNRATFTIRGSETFTGEGNIWSKENPSPGTYTITWGEVQGCKTPSTETKTFRAGDKISFLGNYTPEGTRTPIAPSPSPIPQTPRTPPFSSGPTTVPKPELQPRTSQVISPEETKARQAPPSLQTAERPKGFVQKIFQPLISFFKKLFSGKQPRPSPVPLGVSGRSGEDALQGIWKPLKFFQFDSAIGDFKEIQQQAGFGYIEFKGNQVCDNGKVNSSGEREPCANYKIFSVKGDEILVSGQNMLKINWKVDGDRLELIVESGALQNQKPLRVKMLLERWR